MIIPMTSLMGSLMIILMGSLMIILMIILTAEVSLCQNMPASRPAAIAMASSSTSFA